VDAPWSTVRSGAGGDQGRGRVRCSGLVVTGVPRRPDDGGRETTSGRSALAFVRSMARTRSPRPDPNHGARNARVPRRRSRGTRRATAPGPSGHAGRTDRPARSGTRRSPPWTSHPGRGHLECDPDRACVGDGTWQGMASGRARGGRYRVHGVTANRRALAQSGLAHRETVDAAVLLGSATVTALRSTLLSRRSPVHRGWHTAPGRVSSPATPGPAGLTHRRPTLSTAPDHATNERPDGSARPVLVPISGPPPHPVSHLARVTGYALGWAAACPEVQR
jgi:hypothetical protein